MRKRERVRERNVEGIAVICSFIYKTFNHMHLIYKAQAFQEDRDRRTHHHLHTDDMSLSHQTSESRVSNPNLGHIILDSILVSQDANCEVCLIQLLMRIIGRY